MTQPLGRHPDDLQCVAMADDDIGSGDSSGRGVPVALIVVLVAFGAFVLQNTKSVDVQWLVFDFSLPLWGLIIVSAVAGILIRDLVRWNRRRREK
jgi:uncharacterized integral membrane protein